MKKDTKCTDTKFVHKPVLTIFVDNLSTENKRRLAKFKGEHPYDFCHALKEVTGTRHVEFVESKKQPKDSSFGIRNTHKSAKIEMYHQPENTWYFSKRPCVVNFSKI